MPLSEAKVFSPPPERKNRVWLAVALAAFAVLMLMSLSLRPKQIEQSNQQPQPPAQPVVHPSPPKPTVLPGIVESSKPVEQKALVEKAEPKGLEPQVAPAAPVALEPGLVAYLPLLEDFNDHGPAKMRVTPMGNVKIENSAAMFDGNSWLALPHIAFNIDAFSVAMWIKLDREFQGFGLLEQYSGGGKDQHLHLVLRDECRPYFGFMMDDLAAGPRITPENGWVHLVFIYDGDSQQIFFNGTMAGERICSAFKGSKGETLIGKAPNWNNVALTNFRGQMREFKIFSRALKPEDVEKTKIYKVPENKGNRGKTEPDF